MTRRKISGWCNDGFHAGGTYRYGTPCPRGETCECECHEQSDAA